MTDRYQIADYLPLEARQIAADASYRATYAHGSPFPRTPEDFCPLGVALTAMRGRTAEAPDAVTVARYIGGDEQSVFDAACAFIDDWDSGRIDDLRAAFGLDEDGAA